MAVYLELVADDVDDIAEWIGTNLGSSNAQVEMLADGDCYISLDLRLRVADDETGEGHPRPLVEVLGDPGARRREELRKLSLLRATIAGRAQVGDELAAAQVARIDERVALLHGLGDLPEPDADELLDP